MSKTRAQKEKNTVRVQAERREVQIKKISLVHHNLEQTIIHSN